MKIAFTMLLCATLALSACGRKGAPLDPNETTEEETTTSGGY